MNSAWVLLQPPSAGAGRRGCPLTGGSGSDPHGCQNSLWRPWLSSLTEGPQRRPQSKMSSPYSRQTDPSRLHGKHLSFQHPVRLFWPKSKSFDYLYSDGVALLRNFPIQATITFYDESDSEDEDEDEDEDEEDCEEDCDSCGAPGTEI